MLFNTVLHINSWLNTFYCTTKIENNSVSRDSFLSRALWPSILYVAGEPMHTASKQSHCVPHSCIYRLERRHFVVSYRACMFNSLPINIKRTFAPLWKLRTISVTNGSHYMPTTIRHFLRWAKMNGTQSNSMKSVLHVQQYGKRYFSGWSDVEQQGWIQKVARGGAQGLGELVSCCTL